MSFTWPYLLFLLVSIPLLVGLYVFLQLRRADLAQRYLSLGFLPQNNSQRRGLRRHIPPFFFLVALIILIAALARPQMVLSLPRVQGSVILAFDVSGSMAADDFKPTRMEAARVAALDFAKHQPRNVQIGVVAFSDNGFTVQAPTNDQDSLQAAIKRLAPQRGTSLANGILTALKTLDVQASATRYYTNLTPAPTIVPTPVPHGTYTSGVIILLSDGNNNENPDPLAAAQAAADRGVRVYTVGIGSPSGTDLKINGFTIHTQLNEEPLQEIALLTGAEYFNAQNETELTKIYESIQTQLVVKAEETEVTSIFAGFGLFFLLLGGLFSLIWFSRLP
ncbi:MAG: VWA domain-containing protein [Chloroflexi bacterium]|nr:VWA domain-containing protein [Chloroflexota bacterium]